MLYHLLYTCITQFCTHPQMVDFLTSDGSCDIGVKTAQGQSKTWLALYAPAKNAGET